MTQIDILSKTYPEVKLFLGSNGFIFSLYFAKNIENINVGEKMKKMLLVIALTAMSMCQILMAQEVKDPNCPNPFKGLILPKGKTIFISKTMYFKKENYYKGSTKETNPMNQAVTMWRENLMLRHGFGHNISAKLQIPVAHKHVETKFGKDDNFGLADIQVFFEYGLWAQKTAEPWALAAFYSITLPTGKDNTSSSPVSSTKPYMMDIGQGAFANRLELKLRKDFGRNNFFVSSSYRIAAEGNRKEKDGDERSSTLSYTRYFLKYMSAKTELTGTIVADSKTDGATQNDGSKTVDWLFGVGGRIWSDLSYDASIEFPIYRHYDYCGLEPDFKLFLKLVYSL